MKWRHPEPGRWTYGPWEVRRELVGRTFARERWVVYRDHVRDREFRIFSVLADAKSAVQLHAWAEGLL